jgi:hypothetical protein
MAEQSPDPKPWQFKKGQSGNPHGRRGKPKAVVEEADDGPAEPVYDEEERPEPPVGPDDLPPSEVLRDLRWAYRNFGVRCRGNPQAMALREMLEAGDRAKFMDLLSKHEQMHLGRVKDWLASRPKPAAGGEAGGPKPLEKDEGLERAVEMCERWLADYAAREAAKGKSRESGI